MKQLLNKLLPNFILQILIKQKYKQYNISVHQENIKNNQIVKIVCTNKDKYDFLKSIFKKSFGGTIKIESYNFYFHPIAIIKKPMNIDTYLKLIGAKSRNMNKKAIKNGIYCQEFDWNKKLDDIYEINTSTMHRQGREMDESYKLYPKKNDIKHEKDFKIIYIGAFKDKILIGYIELYIYGNFAMTNRILGHKEFLKFGVMNLMIKECIEYMINNDIEYINYLTMQNRKNNSLSAFKYRVGFREYSLLELIK
jgi:hypothetical protein